MSNLRSLSLKLFYPVLLAVSFIFLSPQTSYAIKCNGVDVPEVTCFGVSKCGVCNSEESTWIAPKIRMSYFNSAVLNSEKDLKANECSFFSGVRFCARRTMPGTRGNTSTDVKLCVFEDPMDGMDTIDSYNPHHFHEPNTGKTEATVPGAVIGMVAGPVGALWGAIIGAMIDGITSIHNHVVMNGDTAIGCVQLPIAEGPPVFRNSAWNSSFGVSPYITYSNTSTFFNSAVKVIICQNTETDDTIVACKYEAQDENGNGIFGEILPTSYKKETIEFDNVKFSSNASSNFRQKKQSADGRWFEARVSTTRPQEVCVYELSDASDTKGRDVGCLARPGFMPNPVVTMSGTENTPRVRVTFTGADPGDYKEISENNCNTVSQVTFCAYKPCMDPNYQLGQTCNNYGDMLCTSGFTKAPLVVAYKQNDIAVGAQHRPPGNILKPKNVEFFNSQAMPEIVNNAITFQKVKFTRDVMVYDRAGCYQLDADGKCLNYAGIANGGVCCDESPSLCNSVPAPYRTNGQCMQYVRNVTGTDPYQIDYTTQNIRPLTGTEMGYCVSPPPNMDATTFSTPGNYNYTVPAHCGKIEVKMWGAGASGTSLEDRYGDTGGDDVSGASGAFIKTTIDVVPRDVYSIVIGHGGSIAKRWWRSCAGVCGVAGTLSEHATVGTNGGDTKISKGAAHITAGGGKAYGKIVNDSYENQASAGGACSSGGGLSCPANHISGSPQQYYTKTGMNGFVETSCSGLKEGAFGWNPESNNGNGAYSSNNLGTDQCDSGAGYDEDLHIDGSSDEASNLKYPNVPGVGGCTSSRCNSIYGSYGNVGTGGHGMLVVRCIDVAPLAY